MIKRIATIVLALSLTLAIAIPAAAATSGGGTVNASGLNLRTETDTSSTIKTVIPRGGSLVVIGVASNGWLKVWYKGYEGYVSPDYVTRVTTLTYDFGTGTIKGSNVRMRSSASLSGSILGNYNSGTSMKVTGVSGEWYQVVYNGTTGYVHSDYMTLSTSGTSTSSSSTSTATTTASTTSATGSSIVTTAKKYLGVRYVWGGTSTSGFDCSGFVYYVFKECGYTTSRTSSAIAANGTLVNKSDLKAGDIICFTSSNYSGVGHVGIYIGDGQFIHASSGSGAVIISSLSSTYYTNHYYSARRVA